MVSPVVFALRSKIAVFLGCVSLGFTLWPSSVGAEEEIGLNVPAGFVITRYADDSLAHDIYSMTLDGQGRVVVSGPGYVKILIDSDGNGQADQAKLFAKGPTTGAQGLCFIGRDLLCTGDAGLIRYQDANADDRADGAPDVYLKVKTGHEHSAHAIRRGPDGWWYIIAGNMTEVSEGYITSPRSPVKHPKAGVLLRLKPDLTGGEVVADGLRNAYDFDFNEHGELFVYDSDGERDISLPWYQPTRLFHTVPGTHHGWVTESWKRPAHFFDSPSVVAETGRGSPTGVACYRHTQFPEKYRGALFLLDWTFGRVFAAFPRRSGDTYGGSVEEFVTLKGQFGFAPTDVEVGMDGSLFICVGGRGTHGTVYRITYAPQAGVPRSAQAIPAEFAGINEKSPPENKLQACLTAPQPAATWSRSRWIPWAKQLGEQPFLNSALSEELPVPLRMRAVEILTELFGGLPEAAGEILASAPASELRARGIWSLGVKGPTKISDAVVVGYLSDGDPLVRRHAVQALAARGSDCSPLSQWLVRCLDDDSRLVRLATSRLVPTLPMAVGKEISENARRLSWRAALTNVWGYLHKSEEIDPPFAQFSLDFGRRVLEGKFSPELKLEAMRLIAAALGDLAEEGKQPGVFDGYACRTDLAPFEKDLQPLRQAVGKLYPTGQPLFDTELSRLIAVLSLEDATVLDKVLAHIDDRTSPTEDVHHLIVAARMGGPRTTAQRTAIARALVGLDQKLNSRKMQIDSHWNDRLGELFGRLVELDPDLPPALLEQPGFGRPGQILFMAKLSREKMDRAVEIFFKTASADEEYPWTNDVVYVIGEGKTPRHYDLIRAQFEKFELRMAILMVLAGNPQEQDRTRFVQGLDSPAVEVLSECIAALEKLSKKQDAEELAGLVKLVRRLGSEKSELGVRERAARLLERNSGEKFGLDFTSTDHVAQTAALEKCTTWLKAKFPSEADAVLGGNEADLTHLKELTAHLDWSTGSVDRGRKLFSERGCAQCHTGGGAVGPDLAGVAGRFSRDDLFIAIVVPSRDVSPRYQTLVIETKAGKTFTGLVVYEAVDGLLLRNGMNQTFRIEARDIETRRAVPNSLMPDGLLKGLPARDLADLYVYLQSLSPQTASGAGSTTSTRKE